MNPNYVYTITLYNRIRAADTKDRKEKWIRTVISGCFYKAQVNTVLTTQATMSNTYTVRNPKGSRYLSYPEFLNTATQLLTRNKPSAFKVTAFSDNTNHLTNKHYRLGG